ncbi:F-box protein [Camellia lanceoleosa]|uniref:F-box protein n=1 Tax=Camellia lanceoleosa TaxID=1840588 RepID=A0ACC0GEZ9_9ERIC|nr:F-box protein [Camellia lanceoleosa]
MKLALRCDWRSINLDDDVLILISLRCINPKHLKLCGCRELINLDMAVFAKNCKGLKKFSCGSCKFGVKGMNVVFDHYSSLKELSVRHLHGINDGGGVVATAEPIGPSVATSSLEHDMPQGAQQWTVLWTAHRWSKESENFEIVEVPKKIICSKDSPSHDRSSIAFKPLLLFDQSKDDDDGCEMLWPSTIFGPTYDEMDVVT